MLWTSKPRPRRRVRIPPPSRWVSEPNPVLPGALWKEPRPPPGFAGLWFAGPWTILVWQLTMLQTVSRSSAAQHQATAWELRTPGLEHPQCNWETRGISLWAFLLYVTMWQYFQVCSLIIFGQIFQVQQQVSLCTYMARCRISQRRMFHQGGCSHPLLSLQANHAMWQQLLGPWVTEEDTTSLSPTFGTQQHFPSHSFSSAGFPQACLCT